MAKLLQYSSQANVPTQPVVQADAGALRPSMASAQALASIGEGLTTLGRGLAQQKEIERQLEEKKQQHLDSLTMTQIQSVVEQNGIEADAIYDNTTNADEWPALHDKKNSEIWPLVNKFLPKLSPDARKLAIASINGNLNVESAKARRGSAVQVSKNNLIAISSVLEDAIATGKPQVAKIAENTFRQLQGDWFATPAEAHLYLTKLKERGFADFQQKQIKAVSNEIAGIIEGSNINDVEQARNLADIASDKSGLSPVHREEMRDFASSMTTQRVINTTKQFDTIVGESESKLASLLKDGKLDYSTISDHFDKLRTSGKIPSDKLIDLKGVENTWKGMVDNDIKRRESSGYNPAEYLDLTKRIESAKDETEISSIIIDSTKKRASGKISKEEDDAINAMGNRFASGQFYNEVSYKENSKRFDSLEIPYISFDNYLRFPLSPGTRRTPQDYMERESLRKKASDWHVARVKTEWNQWYSLNKDKTNDEQKRFASESIVLRYGNMTPEHIIEEYKTNLAQKTVSDNKYMPSTTPSNPQFTYIMNIGGKRYGSNTGGTDLSKWTEIK